MLADKAMSMSDDAMHQMDHGDGMDVQAIARDMRNRFWISLVFAVPIFLLHPTGLDFIRVKPPLGLDLNLILFFLASAAILYPGWPFVVDAVRAIRNGVLNMAVLVVLSVGTGYLFSIGATFLFKGEQFYEASAVLLVFILLSCSLSRAQTRSLVSGFRRTENKQQSDAHGRRQRLKTPVNKLSCAGWLPHDRDSVSGCLVLETSVGTGRLITGLEDSLRLPCLPPYAPAR
jgi:cation transport ATPase